MKTRIYNKANDCFEKVDLEEMSREELQDLKAETYEEKIWIDDQIDAAKAKAVAGDGYSDPDWFRRAITASKHKGKVIQDIQTVLARKPKSKKGHRNFADEFMDVARERLDQGTFDTVFAVAEERIGRA